MYKNIFAVKMVLISLTFQAEDLTKACGYICFMFRYHWKNILKCVMCSLNIVVLHLCTSFETKIQFTGFTKKVVNNIFYSMYLLEVFFKITLPIKSVALKEI